MHLGWVSGRQGNTECGYTHRMGEVNEFCFFCAGESWTSPFSLGLSFPIRALGWMVVTVPPISGCVKVVSLGGLERLGACVCV